MRGKEHGKSLEKRDKTSVLWRHAQEEHDSQVPAFKMNVTGVHGNDAMLRQITEAVKIKNAEKIINVKGEWNEPLLPHVKTGNHVIDQNKPSRSSEATMKNNSPQTTSRSEEVR